MGRDVRFLILNCDEQSSKTLRTALLGSERVKIVAEVDEPAMLAEAVTRFHVDAVLVNLDPAPEAVLPFIGDAADKHSHVAFFATSESTDGPLILKAMRSGVSEFLPRPIEGQTLREAIDRLVAQRGAEKKHGKIITVTGAAGGVGATFLATNLAVELAAIVEGGVAIVDLDYRFGQVATVLDVEPTYTLSDLCETPEQLEPQVIERALVRHDSGVHILSRPASFTEADMMTGASCVGLLSTLAQMNEYVVVDGPVRSDVHAKSVLDLADVNLFVVQLIVPCIRNAARILRGIREEGDGITRARLIANRVGRSTADLSVEDASGTLDMEVFATIPDDWMTVSGAINLGEPLMSRSPKTKVRQNIQEIAARLHTPESSSDEHGEEKKGLIGRIFA